MTVAHLESNLKNISSQVLFDLFKQYTHKQFVFVRPGGNFGDTLIYLGAEKLAELAGINYKTVEVTEYLSAKYPADVIVYIHGSGGLVSWWSGTPFQVLEKASLTHQGTLILGPSTCSTETDFLEKRLEPVIRKNACKEIFLFARDRMSYEILNPVVSNSVKLFLDHDTALNLAANDLINTEHWRNKPFTLFSIRADKDKMPFVNKGVSGVWIDPVSYCRNFTHWLFVHSKANSIITNRLHSAIVGCVFNKIVILLPNRYHKNRSVWEYSHAQRAVKWSDVIPEEYYFEFSKYIFELSKTELYQRFLRYFNKIRLQDMR